MKKNNNKKYGLEKERAVKRILESQGFKAFRCRGSFGCFDIISCNGLQWKLIQVKATRQQYASYKSDMEQIAETEVPPGTSKELWIWWSPHKLREQRGWEIIRIENNVKGIKDERE